MTLRHFMRCVERMQKRTNQIKTWKFKYDSIFTYIIGPSKITNHLKLSFGTGADKSG